jgi:flagellar basal-body rod protein FlgF
MGKGIYMALSGAVAQQSALDVAANNVANAATTGFRAERVHFEEVLSRAHAKDAAFVAPASTATDETAGPITPTGNPLDLALQGDGFFAIDTPQGVRYTRAGDFRPDSRGRLVNGDGFAVRGTDGKPIAIPPDAADVQVAADGAVVADGETVGTIAIQRFPPGSLEREGAKRFAATTPPVAGEAPRVVSGAIEQGNFNVVRGVVELVRVSRLYESLHRMLEGYKQIEDRAARSLGSGGNG